MKLLILATLISALIFLIIDVIWLSFSVKSFYRPNIGHLLLDTPVMWAAILFYLIYVIGLAVVIIEPSLDYQNVQKFILKASYLLSSSYHEISILVFIIIKFPKLWWVRQGLNL